MYKVIKAFDDLQDTITTKAGTVYHHYDTGDLYPRKGLEPSNERIMELATDNNAQKIPLIEALPDVGESEASAVKTADMPTIEKEKKKVSTSKRSRKKAADQELMPDA